MIEAIIRAFLLRRLRCLTRSSPMW